MATLAELQTMRDQLMAARGSPEQRIRFRNGDVEEDVWFRTDAELAAALRESNAGSRSPAPAASPPSSSTPRRGSEPVKNYIQAGRTVTVPAPTGGALSSDPVLVGSLFGVAAYTAAQGAPLEIQTEGVFDLPKAATITFAIGDKVYFDPVAENETSVSSGGTKLIGQALAVAGSTDTLARVRLPGMVIA